MKTKVLLLVIPLLFLGASCFQKPGVSDPSTQGPENAPMVTAPSEAPPGTDYQLMEQATDETLTHKKVFNVMAKQWEFIPTTITVEEGDTVVINLSSPDVAHSFTIDEFEVNEKIEPEQNKTFEFVADKTGIYSFYCAVYCGAGHGDMKGTLKVE